MTALHPRVIATGELVRLREKITGDAERDYEWRCDPELAAYDAARPLTARFQNFLASFTDELTYPTQQRRTFAIEELEGGAHIGNVMYYGYDPYTNEAELGITIGDRSYWGHGYGTDAVRCMLRYLFTVMGLKRVYLHTLTWNYRAQTAFQRAGFEQVRRVTRGGYDFINMEIRAEDYHAALAADAAELGIGRVTVRR